MTVHIDFDPDRHTTDRFELQWGRLGPAGERVLRKTARTAEAQRLVHAEVNAGNLIWGLGDTMYPLQLCRVVDHDLTGERPHVTTTYRGTPVDAEPGAPAPEKLLTIFSDLLVAIRTLGKAGLTHGAILPGHVLWDGAHAQLVNLGEVVAVGEPARAALEPVWLPPPGPEGLRLAGEAHDVYQAGMVVYCLALQAGPAAAAAARDELARGGGSALSALLDGVFADDPRERPDPHRLLRRIEEARYEPVWQSPDPADATTLTIQLHPVAIPQQYSPPAAVARVALPSSPAREEFRRLVAAKRRYRAARARPRAVAWRYARQTLDVLWYSRDELSSKILLGIGALVFVGLPLLFVIYVVSLLGGAK
jgi:hypothetical protein